MNDITAVGDITNQVTTLSESIFKFGVSTVIIAVGIIVFLIVGIAIFKSSQKQFERTLDSNKNMMENMQNQNNDLIKFITDKCNTAEPKLVTSYLDINISLRSICKTLITKLECSRVAVYVFHNGNKSSHGLPFFKMSCIGEWTRRNAGTCGASSQSDLPLYLFSDMVESLYEHGEYLVNNIDLITESHLTDFVCPGNKSLVAFQITDEYENLAGFTVVEFRDEKDFSNPAIINNIKTQLIEINQTIGDIIIDSNIEDRIKGN